MLNMSDRDTKIILVLLIVAVIALPYVFFTKGTRENTERQKADNITLQNRLTELQEMNKNRDFYIAETERMKKERDDLIASFPAEVAQENYTMFLQYLEYNSIVKAEEQMLALLEDEEEEDQETPRFGYEYIEGNSTVMIREVGYGDNDYIAISEEGAEDMLTGVINDSTLTFVCYYDGFRYLMDYIQNYEDPMIYRELSAEYDPDTGLIEGEILLEQYAIAGKDRVLEPVPVWPDIDELELRGLQGENLFGPLSPDTLYVNQLFQVYLEQLAEEAEEEGGEEEGAGEAGEATEAPAVN